MQNVCGLRETVLTNEGRVEKGVYNMCFALSLSFFKQTLRNFFTTFSYSFLHKRFCLQKGFQYEIMLTTNGVHFLQMFLNKCFALANKWSTKEKDVKKSFCIFL